GPRALARLTPGNGVPAAGTLRGSLALGALNGAVGDRLAESGNPLALDMTLRGGGYSPQIAVFVHGLCETDDAWALFGDRPYEARLEEDLGYTPLYLRYNTGLHISDNGRRLAALLEETVESWPVPVEEIVLVGHSMGGLVARSACHYGGDWTQRVRHVFCLGSPHLGAPLEKAANLAAYALARLPETRPLAKVVNGRSVGIKDLRFGSSGLGIGGASVAGSGFSRPHWSSMPPHTSGSTGSTRTPQPILRRQSATPAPQLMQR